MNIKDFLKRILLVSAGTLLIAFGSSVFIIPFGLVTGGMSGAAIVINKLLSGVVSIDFIIAVLSWGAFFVGLLVLGRTFALKTLISTALYPPLISLTMRLASPDVLGGYFYLQGSENPDVALIISAVLGGVFVGAGCALAFLGGGSTGGFDIAVLIVVKLFPRFKSSRIMLFIDGAIVLLGAFVSGSLVFTMLGVMSALCSSFMLDKVFLFEREAFTLQIISDAWPDINREIIEKHGRTATLIDAAGGYTGIARKMLVVTVSMREYPDLVSRISGLDPHAFVTVHRAHEIRGEGWEKR